MGSAAETTSPPSSSSQSPVPYLFCGLAAMLGLIAFALLLLGCSYWKPHRSRDDEGDLEADGGAKAAPPMVELEEKYVVIMAGQEKPTFLAASSRLSSFGSRSSFRSGTSETSLALDKNFENETESESAAYQFQ